MELTAQKRDVFGKKLSAVRRQELIPAELYGQGVTNIHLTVPQKDFNKTLKEAGENTIINLNIDGEIKPVLIYEVARHPVSNNILNIDFYQVRMDQEIETTVPLEFINESPAVKEKSAVLVKIMQEIEIEALPANIPPKLEVDLSKLVDLEQALHVSDLPIAELKNKGVKVLSELESVIAIAKPQMTEEEEKALEEAAASVESVKVEGEEKKEEEGETAAAEESKKEEKAQ